MAFPATWAFWDCILTRETYAFDSHYEMYLCFQTLRVWPKYQLETREWIHNVFFSSVIAVSSVLCLVPCRLQPTLSNPLIGEAEKTSYWQYSLSLCTISSNRRIIITFCEVTRTHDWKVIYQQGSLQSRCLSNDALVHSHKQKIWKVSFLKNRGMMASDINAW